MITLKRGIPMGVILKKSKKPHKHTQMINHDEIDMIKTNQTEQWVYVVFLT
jgi:hypothetical protein